MRVLLVEPQYRKGCKSQLDGNGGTFDSIVNKESTNDDTLWYPPLGLMKLSRFHINRGDEVVFVNGCDTNISSHNNQSGNTWDRVYITTLFTFHWKNIVNTIKYYLNEVGGTVSKVYVGGIMASLMAKEIFEETGVYPILGVIESPSMIGLSGDDNIDLLPPDYNLLDPHKYAINDTYYGYTSRGCINSCPWCGVPRIETKYVPYIDIKPMIRALRNQYKDYGDKSRLYLMDNNVLASAYLEKIVNDLEELGYGRNAEKTKSKKQRVVDFNQGLDASYINDKTMKLISRLNIRPMRIAFDRVSETKQYINALTIAKSYGVKEFSNYMLYNWKDNPRDLYERLKVNICLNEKWGKGSKKEPEAEIYSYPMRYSPIDSVGGNGENKSRDLFYTDKQIERKWYKDAIWTRRFVRNIEVMKGAAHGAISPTPSLAWRTIGNSYDEYLSNLYMPEELLRNRNKHEKRVYDKEPKRPSGSGKVEQFRKYIIRLLRNNDLKFKQFHSAVCENSVEHVRNALLQCKDQEMRQWLLMYLKR